MKISGVSATGLAGLHEFLKTTFLGVDLEVEKGSKKPFVQLKDVRLKDDKVTYLVTLDMVLIDETTAPETRMRLGLMMGLMRSMDFRLLPEFDGYGDGERDLEEFKVVLGKSSPFEVRDKKTGHIILQKDQQVTLGRLKEIVAAPIGGLDWSAQDCVTDESTLFNKLLCWMNEGGVCRCEFRQYRFD